MQNDNDNKVGTKAYQGWKIEIEKTQNVLDVLTIESPLTVKVNDESLTITMRTPGHDLELTRGILHSENIIKSTSTRPKIELECDETNFDCMANVYVPEELVNKEFINSRSLLSVASCGICGKTELEQFDCQEKIQSGYNVNLLTINNAFNKMALMQTDFSKTGGCHAAAAFDEKGNLLVCREDIGRHNAVDKVIGSLIFSNTVEKAQLLIVSGRISYEIVIKCFKAKIPVLAAVSAPSSLAVDFAKEFGITLLGFCRGNRATCYANPSRLSIKNDTFNDH